MLGYKLKLILPKQNQKQINHESNKLCMFQAGKKTPQDVLKRIKTILSTL